MILAGLNNIVQQPEDLESQIKFCELRAIVTAKNGDRDISKMYSEIAKNIRILSMAKSTPTTLNHDRSTDFKGRTHQMDKTSDQNGQHASTDGAGIGQLKKKEYP